MIPRNHFNELCSFVILLYNFTFRQSWWFFVKKTKKQVFSLKIEKKKHEKTIKFWFLLVLIGFNRFFLGFNMINVHIRLC